MPVTTLPVRLSVAGPPAPPAWLPRPAPPVDKSSRPVELGPAVVAPLVGRARSAVTLTVPPAPLRPTLLATPPKLVARSAGALALVVERTPPAVTVTDPPVPPEASAQIALAPAPWVVITEEAVVVRVTEPPSPTAPLPSAPVPSLPPFAIARMPWESAPEVRIVPLLVRVTDPPPPPSPP
ncbi:MAG: hypothetical protein B7Y12_03565 [Rhizobiales bacterium 24-66-13]|nr:MAG: hypothetical protein B7Y12_03565 [Rhizobiales bacterium 24-66-13]